MATSNRKDPGGPPRASQRQPAASRGKRSGMDRRSSASRGPLLLGVVALLAMLAVLAWAVRGLFGPGPAPVVSPTAPATELPLPVVSPTPATGGESSSVPETPSPAPTPSPTPTPPPPIVVGTFGELPAPNLPQVAFPSGQVQLEYDFLVDLSVIPSEAPVYRLIPREWDEARVTALAHSLGLEGGVVQPTAGGGWLVRSPSGQLVVSDWTIQYQAAQTGTSTPEVTPATVTPQPSTAQLLAWARDWLEQHGLVTTPLDEGTLLQPLDGSGVAVVRFGPAEPRPVLSAVPGALVALTSEGTIQQATVTWPARFEASAYSLRPAETIREAVLAGRGVLEFAETVLTQARLPLTGKARIIQVTLAWVDAGQGPNRYLTPVVRFTGEAEFEGLAEPVEIHITVPAVAAQAAPRG